MKNVLVIGSTGQIGSELTRELRKRYGNDNIVAGFIKGAEPTGELKETGPAAEADVTNPEMITMAQETLLLRPRGFSPLLWLLIPAFSLPTAPPNLPIRLHR